MYHKASALHQFAKCTIFIASALVLKFSAFLSLILQASLFGHRGGQLSWNLKIENVGDHKCHDYFNRPECLYDLGDCCQEDTFLDQGVTCYSCYCYSEYEGTYLCTVKTLIRAALE